MAAPWLPCRKAAAVLHGLTPAGAEMPFAATRPVAWLRWVAGTGGPQPCRRLGHLPLKVFSLCPFLPFCHHSIFCTFLAFAAAAAGSSESKHHLDPERSRFGSFWPIRQSFRQLLYDGRQMTCVSRSPTRACRRVSGHRVSGQLGLNFDQCCGRQHYPDPSA